MADFILAALPWIIFGIVNAVVIVDFQKKNKIRNIAENREDLEDVNTLKKKENIEEEEDYMSVGMSLGMCIGMVISLLFTKTFGTKVLIYGVCFGMLGGMMVGTLIKKK